MSPSFMQTTSTSEFEQPGYNPSHTPPSLTSSSSPASTESVEDLSQAKLNKRTQGAYTQPKEYQAFSVPTTSFDPSGKGMGSDLNGSTVFAQSAWSPSGRTDEGEDAFMGNINSAADPFQSEKGPLESMGFGSWDAGFSSFSQEPDMSMDMDSAGGMENSFTSPRTSLSPAAVTASGKPGSSVHGMNNGINLTSTSSIVSSPSGSDVKRGISTALSTRAGSVFGSEHHFGGSGEESDSNWLGKASDNDEAMFDSLIQAGSFGPPSAGASEHGDSPQPMTAAFDAMTLPPSNLPSQHPSPNDVAKGGISSLPGARASSPNNQSVRSSLSSRRNSGESSERQKQPGPPTSTRRFGCQTAVNSNNLDSDLGYSAFTVVRPTRAELKDLQVHVHGVPMQGAKSRVETQIRMRLELVRPSPSSTGMVAPGASRSDQVWERIGSFTHIKLPPLSGTKRKSKKYQRNDVPPEKTLFVDATVVNATPPHERVFVCKGCRQRERKRAHRKKDPKAPIDTQPTPEEMRSLGIDPQASDAMSRAMARMEEEEKKRVVLFNCGDFVDFHDGEAVLPTRITCYCRHHKEKIGFCVIFTMRDWQGKLIATGSTPPIMITDDHKSMGIAAQQAAAAAAAAAGGTASMASGASTANTAANVSALSIVASGPIKQVNGTGPRSRGASAEHLTDEAGSASAQSGNTTPNNNAPNAASENSQRRRERAKPYSDSQGSRRRRNTSNKDLSMTPFSGTGNNTPVVAVSPQASQDSSSNDFISAFTAVGSTAGIGRNGSVSSSGVRTPGEQSSNSKAGSPSPLTAGQSCATRSGPSSLDEGSLSPDSLTTNLQSLPGFDFEQFFRNYQNGSLSSSDIPQLMAMAMGQNLGQVRPLQRAPAQSLPGPPQEHDSLEPRPYPRISKLIPGEGPTSGGTEVTVLGENFVEGITCVFGDNPATHTRVWASNTLVCVLPPSPSPGPVVVSLKGPIEILGGRTQIEGGPLQLFTYIDTTDRALMELALQVVGLQMTGQMRSAREVAMRVVGSGQQPGMGPGAFTNNQASDVHHGQSRRHSGSSTSRDAIAGFFQAGVGSTCSGSESQSFQNSVMQFLALLDADIDEDELPAGCKSRQDAVRLANKQGHTLLHLAVMLGFHRLVGHLLARGCPVNARDNNGGTALHFAALLGRVTIARLLLRFGARDDIPNAEGLLPVDLARQKEQIDVEMVLVENASPAAEARRGPAHHDSGISISDDSQQSSDGELDDDNISTSFEEYGEPHFTSSEESDGADSADDLDSARVPGPDGSLVASAEVEKAELAAAEAQLEAQQRTHEKSQAFKSWISKAGDSMVGVDWVNKKLPGGFNLALFPRPVADRFAQLQMPSMPAIPVFHLGLPAPPSMSFMPWSSSSAGNLVTKETSNPSVHDKGKGKVVVAKEDAQDWSGEEHWKLFGMWRSLVEESSLWAGPSSPPPTYESTVLKEVSDVSVDEGADLAMGSNTTLAIASTSNEQRHVATCSSDELREIGVQGARLDLQDRSAIEAFGSGSALHTKPTTGSSLRTRNNAPQATRIGGRPTPSTRRPRNLRDDAMLVWFWIPVLLLVVVTLLFSSSSSVLSWADLVSYINIPLDYYRPAQQRMAQVGAAAAARFEDLAG